MRCLGAILLLLVLVATAARAEEWQPSEGRELLGTTPPEWVGLRWLREPPSTSLAGLRGRPVLVRFWTTGCPYCTATAPALNEIHRDYAGRGLVVVGIHHPKSRATRGLEAARAQGRALGFRFALAVDDEWRTLSRWWLEGRSASFTSVTFLLDGEGVARWFHDGGEFHPGGPASHERCRQAYASLRGALEAMLGGG